LFIEGADIKAGDPVCVLSAMKMETVVTSPVSGKIEHIAIKEIKTSFGGE